MDLTKQLQFTYIFRGLAPSVVSTLAALATVKSFQGGDILVRQFERSRDLYVILEGEALIRSFAGEVVAEFGPGSVIGEMALIDDQPRSATIVARGNVKVAIFSAELLQGMMATDPEVSSVLNGNIAKVLCRKMRSMNGHLETTKPNNSRALIA